MAELIITFVSLLAAILGIKAYVEKNVIELNEFKNGVLNTFNNARKRTETLADELKKFCNENNCYNNHFMQGFTYQETIDMMQKALELFLNDENLKLLKKIKRKSLAVEKLAETMEVHEKHVIETQNYFKKYILNENLNDSIFL